MAKDTARTEPLTSLRRTLVLAATLAIAVGACGGSAATPAPTAGPTTAPVATEVPAATSAPTAETPTEAAIPAPEAGTFRMGTEPWLGYGPWWIANEKGYFKDAGLDATVTNFDTDDQINTALVSGQIDGANIATHTALRLISSGTPITIVMLLDQSNTADAILSGAEIATIADMKGRKVAYEEGTTSDILLRYALTQAGLTIDDVVRTPMPAAQAGIALIAKQVDVAVTYEPYLTSALAQDSTLKLLYTAEQKPGLIGDVFVVRNDYLAKNPGQVFAALKAWDLAMGFYRSDTAAAQGIIETAVGATPGDLKTAFDGVLFYNVAEAKALMTGGGYGATLTDVKKIAVDAGIIVDAVDETKVMDTSFVSTLAR